MYINCYNVLVGVGVLVVVFVIVIVGVNDGVFVIVGVNVGVTDGVGVGHVNGRKTAQSKFFWNFKIICVEPWYSDGNSIVNGNCGS